MRTNLLRLTTALTAALALALGSTGAATAKPGPPGPGNSPNSKACQKGGWTTLATSDNQPFASEQECTAYAANGGVLKVYVPPTTNHAPVAVDDSYTISVNQWLSVQAPGVLANDTDADGDALSVYGQAVRYPLHGDVTFRSNGSFLYVPNGEFVGTDSFTYTVTDGTTISLATVTITVHDVL